MDNNQNVLDNEKQQTSLMEKLEKLQKKQLFYSRLSALLIAVAVAAILVLLPALLSTLKAAGETLSNANDAILIATDTILQADTTLKDVSAFANEGTTGITSALGKIDDLNIDGLNAAIGDLQAVVEPMANLFRR